MKKLRGFSLFLLLLIIKVHGTNAHDEITIPFDMGILQMNKEMVGRVDNRPYQAMPCLMVDGVIIYNPDLNIDLDPELVDKIDVIKEKYFVGSYAFPGIVNVMTKKADFRAVPLQDYMTRINYPIAERPAK